VVGVEREVGVDTDTLHKIC